MLTKKAERAVTYLEVKHYCIWQQVKEKQAGCDVVVTTNPKTKENVTKFGYKFDEMTGHAVKIEKYDTEKKYATRYYGFKLHLMDGGEQYVLDMPYKSRILSRFMRCADNFDFTKPITLTVWKGYNKERKEDETAIWFKQEGQTVKAFFTKDEPNGMPPGKYDDIEQKWDFAEQHRWLVKRFQEQIMPLVEAAGKRYAAEHVGDDVEPVGLVEHAPFEPPAATEVVVDIDDSDLPF